MATVDNSLSQLSSLCGTLYRYPVDSPSACSSIGNKLVLSTLYLWYGVLGSAIHPLSGVRTVPVVSGSEYSLALPLVGI